MIRNNDIWKKITTGVFVIAEAGKNFIRSLEDRPVLEYLQNAKELVDKAIWAGADAIKFQTHDFVDEQLEIKIISPHFKGMDRYHWVKRNTDATPIEEFWKPLKQYCNQKGIIFFSTPMSRGAAYRLIEIGVPLWKIGSGDILDFVCMDYLRNSGIPIIISSGMSTMNEIKAAVSFLREKNNQVALVHCLSKYPGLPNEANLAILQLFKEKFPDLPIGFSENSISIEPSLIAVALGAKIIEKHITINREDWGSDHRVSSTPEEFRALVEGIRKIENSVEERNKWLHYPNMSEVLGKKEKILKKDEKLFRPIFRKALVAARNLDAGTILDSKMVYAMRPQKYIKGLSSEKYEFVLGKKINKNLSKYEAISEDILS